MKEANQKERKGKQEKERKKSENQEKPIFGPKSHQKGDPTETQNQE